MGYTCHFSTHDNVSGRAAKATASSKANLQAQEQQQNQSPQEYVHQCCFFLCLTPLASSLTSTCLSVQAPNNDHSDEDGSSSNRSTTSPSSPFDSSASSSTSWNAQEKDLNDLGYLHHNADNLLGYLEHVRPNRSSYHMSTLTRHF